MKGGNPSLINSTTCLAMSETQQIIFPPKVTGFHNPSDSAPELQDLKPFHLKCQAISAVGLLNPIEFFDYSAEPSRSYHLQLAEDSRSIGYFLFLNKYAPLVAISKMLDNSWKSWDGTGELPPNQYIDFPELEAYFQPDFQLIPVATLLLPIDADKPESAAVVQNLQDSEFAEFSYFAPQNLGNLVFNNWEKAKR